MLNDVIADRDFRASLGWADNAPVLALGEVNPLPKLTITVAPNSENTFTSPNRNNVSPAISPTQVGRIFNTKDNELYKRIDEILHYIWDLIGVAEIPQCRDEYQPYLPKAYQLVKSGKNKKLLNI